MSGMERPEGLMQDGKLPRRCLLGLRAWPSTVFLTRSQRSENVKLESDCHKVFCAHNFGSHFLLVSTGGGAVNKQGELKCKKKFKMLKTQDKTPYLRK
jgi:hypothetical protein